MSIPLGSFFFENYRIDIDLDDPTYDFGSGRTPLFDIPVLSISTFDPYSDDFTNKTLAQCYLQSVCSLADLHQAVAVGPEALRELLLNDALARPLLLEPLAREGCATAQALWERDRLTASDHPAPSTLNKSLRL